MGALANQIHEDMMVAMKAHDDMTRTTLRMAIAAIKVEAVSGDEARELTDDEVIVVLNREVAKRRDSAGAYAGANRPELAAKELSEVEILQRYLPAELTDDELDQLIAEEIAAVAEQLGAKPSMKQMGMVMKAVTPRVAGRAEGGKVAGKVRASLA